MLYRILAVLALFFFTACGGGKPGLSPQTGDMARKPANSTFQNPTFPSSVQQPAATQQPTSAEGEMGAAMPVPTKVVKIGLLVPMTGDASDVGTALMDAATLALMDKYGYTETENLKVKVVLVPKDTKGTPDGAVAAAQHVLDAGAELIVGPLFSQNVSAVAPLARRYGINVISFSNNPDVAGEGIFVFGFSADQQVKRIVNYALNRNLRSVALLGPNNPYGTAVQQSATEVMDISSMALTTQELYSPVSSAGDEIEKIATTSMATPFSALLLPEGGQKLVSIVNALRARGITPPNVRFLGTGLWDEPTVLRSGALIGGWFVSSPPERFAAYERRFRDFFGYAPHRLSSLAYDAMALAASLAMAPHDANFTADAITDPVGYNGPVNGVFRCLNTGICERSLAVLEVTRSGAKVIDPAPAAFNY